MMMSPQFMPLISFVGLGISLVVYLAIVLVALMLLRRYPLPSMLVLASVLLSAMARVSFLAAPAVMNIMRFSDPTLVYGVINLIGAAVHGASMALLVMAVYVGRPRTRPIITAAAIYDAPGDSPRDLAGDSTQANRDTPKSDTP